MISDADARALVDSQRAYRHAQQDADRTRLDYYQTLIKISDAGGTYDEIAAILGVHRSRVGQLMQQARQSDNPSSSDSQRDGQ